MEWINAAPKPDDEGRFDDCIYISDGEEPSYTTDTADIEEALADYCRDYRTEGNTLPFQLHVIQYRDGEEYEWSTVNVCGREEARYGLEILE